VKVNPGYEHTVWNKDFVPEPLQNSHINPHLEFLFRKTKDPPSNTIESKIRVTCDIKRSSSDQENESLKRFGWCQNHLHVELQCLEDNAATLLEYSAGGTVDLKNMETKQTQATCSQATYKATVGHRSIASASASLTKPSASTLESSQRMMERPAEYISGTQFKPHCHVDTGPKPNLTYAFNFQPELPKDKFPDGCNQEHYQGMCSTVCPRLEGVWGMLSEVDDCEYELRVQRDVCELVCDEQYKWSLNPKYWRTGKQKLVCDCNEMVQKYKVKLYINHKMSNIETLEESVTLSRINPKNVLMEVRSVF